MGQSFSAQTLKIKLKMGVQRCNMLVNKKSNQIKVSRKEIAQLLIKEKDESARIKVEGVLAEMNMVRVLEIISLMCDLLYQRIALIASSTEPPPDLIEAISTIIYCSKRVEVPELIEIATQFQLKWGAKLGPEWYKQHVNNAHKTVSQKVIDRLSIQPPSFDAVIEFLQDVAKQYQIEWEPTFERPADDKDNPDVIGSVAAIRPGGQAPKIEEDDLDISGLEDLKGMQKSGDKEFPGTINIIAHGCKNLFTDKSIGKVDAYLVISLDGIKPALKSSVDHSGNTEPKWDQEHFPFSVKGSGAQLRVEVRSGDKTLGSTLLSIDALISNQSRQWYPLQRGDKQAGSIDFSVQYMPVRVNPNPVYDSKGGFATLSQPQQPQPAPGPSMGTPPPMGGGPGYFYGPGGPVGYPGSPMPMGQPGIILSPTPPPGTFLMPGPGGYMTTPMGQPIYYGPPGGQPGYPGGPIPMQPGQFQPGQFQPGQFQQGGQPFMMVPGSPQPTSPPPQPGGQPILSPQPLQPGQGGPSMDGPPVNLIKGEPSPQLTPGSGPIQQPGIIRIDPHSDPLPDEKESKKSGPPVAITPEDEDEGGEPGDQMEGDGVPGFDELERRFRALKNP